MYYHILIGSPHARNVKGKMAVMEMWLISQRVFTDFVSYFAGHFVQQGRY